MRVSADRRAARERRRRIIFNNDGCDSFCNDGRMTAESLLEARTSALADSQVDSLFYCTNKGGVGSFCHATRVGDPWIRRDGNYARNVTPTLIEQGRDPLSVMAEWSRSNGREIFWSLRMNDTHDGWGPVGDFSNDRISTVKRKNPGWLLGADGRKPLFGCWTALNYALEPVRDWVFRLIEDVCRRYDLDGVECDFLRHETFFPSTAAGEPCTDAERAAMTGLVRHLRGLLDEVASARGKPFLLAIRVPDSVELARDLGLDVEAWLAEGLVDLVSASCYYRLTPWSDLVDLGRRHGVPVYPCLSESRLKLASGQLEPLRNTLESLRGRALNAWQAGADGICVFNLFDPRSRFWREAGDPAELSRRSRIHFASVRGMGGALWRVPRVYRYRRLPLLAPERAPGSVVHVRGEMTEVAIDAGGDLSAAQAIELRMRVADLDDPAGVAARWNGRWLPAGALRDGCLCWPLAAAEVRPVGNRAGLVLAGAAGPVWEDLQIWVSTAGTVGSMEASLTSLVTG